MKFESKVAEFWATNSMEEYFEPAESKEWVGHFWNDGKMFRKYFDQLQIDNKTVVEIASGRGRHSELVAPRTKEFIGVDVSDINIEFCKNRLSRISQAKFVLTDGTQIPGIKDNSVDAVFSYDSMVHFEEWVVFSYLAEIGRVLRKGGAAVLHHSMLSPAVGNPNPALNPGGRWTMDLDLFDNQLSKHGLRLGDRVLLDWSSAPLLDALTFLIKD